jgi:hypothetical protein
MKRLPRDTERLRPRRRWLLRLLKHGRGSSPQAGPKQKTDNRRLEQRPTLLNKGVQATAYSVRSFVASAVSRA